MILHPRRTRANRWPDVVLRCDGVACNERETFAHRTSYAEITTWCSKNFWTIMYRNEAFQHRCARCQRLTKAPAAYLDRLQA